MTPKMRTAIKAAMAEPQKKSEPVTSPHRALISLIEHRVQQKHDPETIIDDLVTVEGAKTGNAGDARYLKLAGIRTTCTWGPYGLLSNWCGAARNKLRKEAGHADA